jgi:hypothetical protein
MQLIVRCSSYLVLHPLGVLRMRLLMCLPFRWYLRVIHIPPPPPLSPSLRLSYAVSEIRYSQIVEEQEHKLCTASNRIELQTQKLDRLRALKDEIAKDEWMFETTK